MRLLHPFGYALNKLNEESLYILKKVLGYIYRTEADKGKLTTTTVNLYQFNVDTVLKNCY